MFTRIFLRIARHSDDIIGFFGITCICIVLMGLLTFILVKKGSDIWEMLVKKKSRRIFVVIVVVLYLIFITPPICAGVYQSMPHEDAIHIQGMLLNPKREWIPIDEEEFKETKNIVEAVGKEDSSSNDVLYIQVLEDTADLKDALHPKYAMDGAPLNSAASPYYTARAGWSGFDSVTEVNTRNGIMELRMLQYDEPSETSSLATETTQYMCSAVLDADKVYVIQLFSESSDVLQTMETEICKNIFLEKTN